MTIRFAPAQNRPNYVSAIVGGCSESLYMTATNDNGVIAANDDGLLARTLRHFADHGLCAAERARDQAILARSAADSAGFDMWLAVCRMLDRRMARSIVNPENQQD